MVSLGNRIKNLREQNNISQMDFAKKLGVSNTVLSRYETGDRKPDYDTLQLIADFFGVSIDYLLGRIELNSDTSQENNINELQLFVNNPKINSFFQELVNSDENDIEQLMKIWDIIKNEKK